MKKILMGLSAVAVLALAACSGNKNAAETDTVVADTVVCACDSCCCDPCTCNPCQCDTLTRAAEVEEVVEEVVEEPKAENKTAKTANTGKSKKPAAVTEVEKKAQDVMNAAENKAKEAVANAQEDAAKKRKDKLRQAIED